MSTVFSNKIKEFAFTVKGVSSNIIVEARKQVSYEIIDKTPFDTLTPGDGGRAKASWLPTIGSPGESDASKRDKTGNETKLVVDNVAEHNPNADFYLTSTCDYINVLEFGGYPDPPAKGTYLKSGQSKDGETGPGYFVFSEDGYSKKAPNGMVRMAAENFSNIVDNAIRKFKK